MPKINHEQILFEEGLADDQLNEYGYLERECIPQFYDEYLAWETPNHRPYWERYHYDKDVETEDMQNGGW